ncbi:hypothetical protein EVJ58_g4258 [Rhodofomes roseus]|uniref:ATP-dependent DNA helicase PIF1 n=1 Tax=Rhodofomes roseus TaxID=34475 RepID=A0A4Y9YIM3_9APHY|nr:hypothetical protein EVJ58_g4258 [Rhodofomes roseus]
MATGRQPISGLRAVKRDFSSSSIPPASQDSAVGDSDPTTIPWTPTPPRQTLTGISQRMKDIQDALNDNISSSQQAIVTSQMARSGGGSQKRPSNMDDSSVNPPAKRRQLPASWAEPEISIMKTSSRTFGSARSANTTTLRVAAATTSKAGSKPGKVVLSAEQTHILNLAKEGKSLFYTGSAALKRKYSRTQDAVAVTASTGIAACNIGGVTVHSFAGIGLGKDNVDALVTRIRKNKKASARWLRTEVLIIDEVSMVEGELFDKLYRIGSMMRKKSTPFGGIQVIVTGDFFQLPPVNKSGKVNFAFEAEMWKHTIKDNTFKLTKVFRQRDQEFVDMLNEMRYGQLSQRSIERFKSLDREIEYEDGVAAAELFPLRQDVDRANATRMQSLDTQVQTYTATDGGTLHDDQQREKMLNNFMVPRALSLKVGAQVMLIKNLDETLVNGSVGKIIKFADAADPEALYDPSDKKTSGTHSKPISSAKPSSKNGKEAKLTGQLMPVVDFLLPGGGMRRHMVMSESFKVELPNGEVQVSRTQLPLILAWAMSIHKSQGQTLERVKVDLAKVFEKGQAYVALSRATTLDGLEVKHFDAKKVLAHPTVVAWNQTLTTVDA